MGTRALTIFVDTAFGEIKETAVLYRQCDGYPTGHGKDLADFLKPIRVVNGISGGATAGTHANGMGCLAAQVVAHFKHDIGQFYLYPAGTRDAGEEYSYVVYVRAGGLRMRAYAGKAPACDSVSFERDDPAALFDDAPNAFDAETINA